MKKSHRENISYKSTYNMVNRVTKFGRKFNIYRSPLEEAFAIYLQEFGLIFEFEPKGFEIETSGKIKIHYIPDFLIVDLKIFIEILNGSANKRLKYKMFWFQQQYPDKKLILITDQHLKKLFSGAITLWDLLGVSQSAIKKAMHND